MKKVFLLIFALLPLLLFSETIVTKHRGNIENVSDVDTTEIDLIYFIQDYQTKSIDRNSVDAIIYDNGQYVTIWHKDEVKDVTENGEIAAVGQKSPSAWADTQVGSLLNFSDGSFGIVFYADDKGHGLVVSLIETRAKWDINKRKHMSDVPDIPNTENAQAEITQLGEGAQYTSAILRHMSSFMCPAAAWCRAQGEDWYLPSASELTYLLRVANGGRDEKGPISRAITAAGGIKLDGDWYWSSSETERTEALNVSEGGYVSSENKDEENAVRAVRAF